MIETKLAILWDLDGTIVDTKTCHFESWRDTLKEHGCDLDRDLFEANFGRNNRTSLPIYLGYTPDKALSKQIIHEKETHFLKTAPQKAPLVKGVESWLADAKEANIIQAIASSADLEGIRSMIFHFNLQQYFEMFISGADLPAKPEPDVFLQASHVLDPSIERFIVIEDSPPGVKAAKRARMTCIAVASGQPKAALGMADLVIEDFSSPLMDALRYLGID